MSRHLGAILALSALASAPPSVEVCVLRAPRPEPPPPRTDPVGTRAAPHEFRCWSADPDEAAENIARARAKRERRRARNLRNRKEPTP